MNHASYRKNNDRSLNSSTYHKKDGTEVRAILKREADEEIADAVSVPMHYQLCHDDTLEPVAWIDHPNMKVPFFASEDEAHIYLAQHGVFELEDFCYMLVPAKIKADSLLCSNFVHDRFGNLVDPLTNGQDINNEI